MPIQFKRDPKSLFIDSTIKAASYVIILSIAFLPVVLFYHSIPLLKVNTLFELLFSDWRPELRVYGLGLFIFVSLVMGACATVLALALGLSLSLFIYHHKGRLGRVVNGVVVMMSGVPTVVYGFVGIVLLVPLIRIHTDSPTGLSLLATIIMLAVLILPTVVSYINQSFNGLPSEVKTASFSLGASRYQFFFYVLIPQSGKGIAIASLLGFARAISDTMLALMISGNSFQFPSSVLESSRALTAHIGLVLPGAFDGIEFKALFFASLVLFALIFLFNVGIQLLDRKQS